MTRSISPAGLVPMLLFGCAALAGGCTQERVLLSAGDDFADGGPDLDGGVVDQGGPQAAEGAGQLSAAEDHACLIDTTGALHCWGTNDRGQLGVGAVGEPRTRPAQPAGAGWRAVSAKAKSTCASRAGGELHCWGANDRGELGLGDLVDRLAPTRVPLPDVASFDAGQDFTCAIDGAGALFCWGSNTEGQLAQGDPFTAPDIPSPVRVGEASDWRAISAGSGHACGLRAGGILYCWGRNNDGQLGVPGSPPQLRAPTLVAGTYASVAAGQRHTCAVDVTGTARCWGANVDGRLGVGDMVPREQPTPVAGATGGWRSVAVSWFHSCGIRGAGELWCWGWNDNGELFEDRAPRPTPSRLGADQRWTHVVVGVFYLCARSEAGVVACQGFNDEAQLGRETGGSIDPTLAPVGL